MLTEWSPHAGQQTPSGQRMAIKRSRQEISSGKAVLTPPSGSCKYIIMFCRRASKSGCNTSCLAVGSRLLVILIARIFALAGSLTHHGLRILTKGGAERLATLVMDLVQGSAALQRRARMELSAAQGPKEIAADLRKRFASLSRSTSYIDWRKQKAFVKDLTGLVSMVETGVAPQDADEAFDLLWSFLQLAPSIHARTDDSNGAVGDVIRSAVALLTTISPRLTVKPTLLAGRILDAVADAGYGEFDGVIPAMAEALGAEGLAHLKQITEAWASAAPTPQEIAQFRQFGLSTSPLDRARRQRQSTASIILADIADLTGDVNAYMARYSTEQLTYGTIAPDVARRLIDAG